MEMRYVEWRDSLASHGWEPIEEARTLRPMDIKTVGFVIDEDDDYVTIAQSYDERKTHGRPHADNIICIPKFAITQSQTLLEVTA
jgi:hypothetical protein